MRPRVWMASLMFAGIMAGCRSVAPPALPSVTLPPASPTAAVVTSAPLSPDPTRTPLPQPVYIIGRELPVNCRFGPGTIYEVISRLDAGQVARVYGKDHTGGWLNIHDPLNPGGFCWLSTVPVDVEGDVDTLPVVDPPYTTVRKVDVYVQPARVTVNCDNFPQYALFIGEITVNGPALVNLRWELSTGEVSEPVAVIFDQAGTKTFQQPIVIRSPNDYVGRLHVNAPNEISGDAYLVANCTP